MMEKNGCIPNDNKPVIRMLAREIGRSNRGRNRILAGAVCACIVTLTVRHFPWEDEGGVYAGDAGGGDESVSLHRTRGP